MSEEGPIKIKRRRPPHLDEEEETSSTDSSISRRALLAGAAAATLASVGAGRALADPAPSGPAQSVTPPQALTPDDTTKRQGRTISELGSRSPYESPRRVLRTTSSGTPHEDLHGIITPSDLHYERHHGGIPEIAPDSYSLLIHGMVKRPRTFTLADLKRFPARSMTRFLECSGNGFRTYRNPDANQEKTPQELEGLTSTSEWIGVPVATLFEEVGVSGSVVSRFRTSRS